MNSPSLPFETQLSIQAKAWRFGFLSPADLIEWADHLIRTMEPPPYLVIELASTSPDNTRSIDNLLAPFQSPDPAIDLHLIPFASKALHLKKFSPLQFLPILWELWRPCESRRFNPKFPKDLGDLLSEWDEQDDLDQLSPEFTSRLLQATAGHYQK